MTHLAIGMVVSIEAISPELSANYNHTHNTNTVVLIPDWLARAGSTLLIKVATVLSRVREDFPLTPTIPTGWPRFAAQVLLPSSLTGSTSPTGSGPLHHPRRRRRRRRGNPRIAGKRAIHGEFGVYRLGQFPMDAQQELGGSCKTHQEPLTPLTLDSFCRPRHYIHVVQLGAIEVLAHFVRSSHAWCQPPHGKLFQFSASH